MIREISGVYDTKIFVKLKVFLGCCFVVFFYSILFFLMILPVQGDVEQALKKELEDDIDEVEVGALEDALVNANKTPYFDLLQREDGLSNLSVSSIIQDKNGFIWIGTQGGLNRYDGEHFLVFRNDPYDLTTLAHNLIQTMFYDAKEHAIWIGTYQGVSRFDINTQKFTNYTVDNSKLSNSIIVAINKDNLGNIWFGTLQGLNKLDPKSNEITNVDLPGDVVRTLCLSSDGDLYIGTLKGVYVLRAGEADIQVLDINEKNTVIMSIKEFDKGILTIGYWDGGVLTYTIDSKEKEYLDIGEDHVYTLEKTHDGTLWIGTWGGGLYGFTKEGTRYHFEGNAKQGSLVNPVVYSLLEDSSGLLWIGTNGGGLNRISSRKANYVLYQHDQQNTNSLSNGKINAIYSDRNNRMWIAVYNQGIDVIDPKTSTVEKILSVKGVASTIPNNMVRCIIDFNGKTLIGTDNGFGYYDMVTKHYESIGEFQQEKVYSIVVINQTQLWIGTRDNGLYLYDMNKGVQKHYHREASNSEYRLLDNSIYALLLDSSQRLWIATNYGLAKMTPGDIQIVTYIKSMNRTEALASNSINCLYESENKDIWIGTSDGGLSVYNNKTNTLKTFTEKEGMSSNTVVSISECDYGNIWAATQNGISILDLSKGDPISITTLTPEDGIGGFEFTKGIYKDSDYLYFSGAHGVVRIPSEYSRPYYRVPKVLITDIRIYNTRLTADVDVYNGTEHLLRFEDSYLSITYRALDFERPDQLNYFVELTGIDNGFIDNGNLNTMNYSRLKPGSYEFKVYAVTSNGVKSDIERVKFTIMKPWYLSRLAILAYCLGALLVVFLSLNTFKSRLIKRKNIELALINQALEKANVALENLSVTDSLTDVYNRRFFESYLKDKVELAIRNKHTLITLVLIDIDDFKEINDYFGHLEGDRLLIWISQLIKALLPRSTDIIARYGGDEFILVLYDTNQEGAKHVIEKIQKALAEEEPKNIGLNKIPTLSFGSVTVLPAIDTDHDDLLKKADSCLYKAKRNGKNQVIFVSEV
jgi:diguanylate cyclase (GGDEF)-like protein